MSLRRSTSTKTHILALDGVVNVNSLFSIALFIGLTWYPTTDPNTNLIADDSPCAAGVHIAEDLVSCHVYSFSSFLFSSLIALALKQAIKIWKNGDDIVGFSDMFSGAGHAHVNTMVLRVGILVSGMGSVFGCGFLTWALVDLVQLKLGVLGCGGLDLDVFGAIGALVVLVPSALVFYVFLVLYAFTR